MAFFLQCPCNRSVKAKFKDRGVTIRADGSVRMSAADLHALRESLMQHWATLGGTCMTGSEDEVWDHVESQLVPSAWSSDCRPIELHVPSLQEQQLYLRRNRPGGAAAAAAASTDASASTAAANAAATQHQQMQQHQQPLPTLSSGARRTPQTPRPQNRSRSRSRGMRLRSRSPRTPEALRQGQQPQAQRDAQDQASASEQSGIGIRERLEQFRKARKAKGCQNSDAIDNVKGKIQNKEEGNQRHGRQREGQDSCARPIPHRSPWSTTPSLRRLMKLAESGKPPPPSLRPSRQLWPIKEEGNLRNMAFFLQCAWRPPRASRIAAGALRMETSSCRAESQLVPCAWRHSWCPAHRTVGSHRVAVGALRMETSTHFAHR